MEPKVHTTVCSQDPATDQEPTGLLSTTSERIYHMLMFHCEVEYHLSTATHDLHLHVFFSLNISVLCLCCRRSGHPFH
jgi:hypothetical protein